MTRWIVAIAALAMACHSALVVVERASSGAIERDHEFFPKPGPDGHYISFPGYAFVNCTDTLDADHRFDQTKRPAEEEVVGEAACQKALGVPRSELTPRLDAFVGYSSKQLGGAGGHVSWATSDEEGLQVLDDVLAHYGFQKPAQWPSVIGSFIHLSDVQIREHDATLGSVDVSAKLDKLVQSFQRDPDQELYSMFVYAAFVDTINKEIETVRDPWRPAPTMMIHTGDAVDAGLQSEFDQFRALSDKLDIPWFQVIGNHDTLAFGNLRMKRANPVTLQDTRFDEDKCEGSKWSLACTCTRTADLIREFNLRRPNNLGKANADVPGEAFTLVPALLKRICIAHDIRGDRFVMNPQEWPNTINAFISAHCRAPFAGGDCAAPAHAADYPVVPSKQHTCADFTGDGRRSTMNGFDLWSDWTERELPVSAQFAASLLDPGKSVLNSHAHTSYGYYCFRVPGTAEGQPRVWAIALNTSTSNGAYGEVKRTQRSWLSDVLHSGQIGEHDLVLVFGHHPIYDIFDAHDRDALTRILTGDKRIVAYLAGHTHNSELRVIHPLDEEPSNHHVWEIVAPAIISYPQQGRQVTLKRVGDLGYIEILSFSPNGSGQSAPKIELAYEGARRDKCQESRRDCENGHPRLPGREVTFPRLFFKMP